MDIYADDFSLSTALNDNAQGTAKEICSSIDTQLKQVQAELDKGLAPQEYAKAQHLHAALIAAHGIITLRSNAIEKQNKG